MLKQTITYTNYNDEEVSEDYYFNLSKAELTQLEITTPGGYGGYLQRIAKEEDIQKIVPEFKEIILMCVGVKSEDGKFFRKSKQIRDDFEASEAYSELFVSLLQDPKKAAEFAAGIVPAPLQAEARAEAERIKAQTPSTEEAVIAFEQKDETIEQIQEKPFDQLTQQEKFELFQAKEREKEEARRQRAIENNQQ